MIDHINHHKSKIFTTEEDSDAKFLYNIGFVPGKSVGYYYINLIYNILSPVFHVRMIYIRISGMLSGYNKYTFIGNISIIIVHYVIFSINTYIYALMIFLPQFVYYNISALLQFLTEHDWLKGEAPKSLDDYAQRCWGRFSGMRLDRGVRGWMIWFLHLIFCAIPYRFGVIMGDLPAHDWHHLCGHAGGQLERWQLALQDRERSIRNGDPLKLSEREIWGLHNALKTVFCSLSEGKTGND